MNEIDLALIDDPYRTCEICDISYDGEYGYTCNLCDIWICNNCWSEHDCPVPAEQA